MQTESPSSLTETWRPQAGPQHAALHCPFQEIFFGGSRGGGKTDLVAGRAGFRANLYGPKYNGVVFRWEMPQSDDLIERAQEIYAGQATFNANKSQFRFKNGARLRFRPLNSVDMAAKYQGQNLTEAYVEEVGNFPDSRPIDRLFATLRSASGVPAAMFMTGNPGGPGQQWVAERYVNPAPGGNVPLVRNLGGQLHKAIYIPSKLKDNRILMHNDPQYVARLHLVGSDELVRAWLEGDWSAVEGAYFDNWSTARHVCRPFPIPDHWLRFRSIDWGSARPFSIGFWAVASDDTALGDGVVLPRGALVRTGEWYGKRAANVGLKLTAEQVVAGIRERSADVNYRYTVADPAMWIEDGGPSLAERFAVGGVPLVRGDNRRVPARGQMGGWDMLRQRLNGLDEQHPMICIFNTCADTIRTLPALQHDETHPEDVNTDMEDHAADEIRYACMSRPWTQPAPEEYDPIERMQQMPTFDEAMQMHEQERQRRHRL